MAESDVRRQLWFIPVLLLLAGCGGNSPKPATAVTTSETSVPSLAGQWEVVSYGRKPLPAGVSVMVAYRADGQVALASKGDPASVPKIDPAKLKSEMEKAARQLGFSSLQSMKIESSGPGPAEVFEVELRRK